MRDRPEETYLDGTFSFTGRDGTEQTLTLKLRTRGKFRRKEERCDFAPLRLNFLKKQVIEDNDDVAERNGMYTINTGNISNDVLDRLQQNLVNVFQYLIGNTEFSLVGGEPDEYCCHNIDLMSATKRTPFTPLAYDFDFAGIVNAPYAKPNPRFEHQSVRHRLFRGQCRNNELLPGTLQQFLDKKDAIYGIVDELELLSSRSKRDVTRYLGDFFDQISQPKSVDARFIKKCEDSP